MRTNFCAGIAVIFLLSLLTGCGGSSSDPNSTSVVPPVNSSGVAISATNADTQNGASGKPFAAPLSATVTENGIRMMGLKVTFTAPSSGPSGTFANGTATDTEITDSNGLATSSAFTANSTAGTYQVTAAVDGAPNPASFSLNNVQTTSFSFYVGGQETATASYYALAGSVTIDTSGRVWGGEQDYNDGGFGFASKEPSGDVITGGTLTFPSGGPAGQGTLTLNTNNMNLGLNGDGTEVFAVQFVNSKHALIMQFDGFDTSSGSMDAQTLPSTLSGPYAFIISGFDSVDTPVAFGGVFSVAAGTISNGVVDVNDSYNYGITMGGALSGTLGPADAYGRGKITGFKGAGYSLSLNYYIVGPEAIRIIDVGATHVALGSAFGQGTTAAFSNASLGNSVLAVSSTPYLVHFGAVGQFATSDTTSATANFSGVGDDNEPDYGVLSTPTSKISGTYTIASNGYGALNVTNGGLGDIDILGIYMTDPALNLNDPNNPSGGGGGIVIDLSDTGSLPGGTGMVIPQTDTSTGNFNGNYVAGWQNYNLNCGDCEFDMLAQGSMTAGGVLSLTGKVSDPFFSLGTPDATSSGDSFSGLPTEDTKHPGRYTMLTTKASIATMIDGTVGPNFYMVIYQANGQQLFWLDYDNGYSTVSFGPLQQQGSLDGLPAATGEQQGTAKNSRRSVARKTLSRAVQR